MTTRMERVAEDIAMAALLKAGATAEPPLQTETLEEAFQSRWPTQGSKLPMNDAMSAAIHATRSSIGQDADRWKTTAVSDTWHPAVQDTIEGYFHAAQRNFAEGYPLEGVEKLTDAVRAALGHIAATRNWPHSTDDDLYAIAVALASGNGLPEDMEEFEQALKDASPEGDNLCAALGASMGRSDMLKFGVYQGDSDGPERDGILFARTTIELANRLSGQAAAS